jgi:hypothetical protein
MFYCALRAADRGRGGVWLEAGKYRNVGPAGLDVQLPRFKVKTQPTSLKKVSNADVW